MDFRLGIAIIFLFVTIGCTSSETHLQTEYEANYNHEYEQTEPILYEVEPDESNKVSTSNDLIEDIPNEDLLWYPIDDNRFNDMYRIPPSSSRISSGPNVWPTSSGWGFRGVPLGTDRETDIVRFYFGEWVLGDELGIGHIHAQPNEHHMGNTLIIAQDSVVFHQFHSGHVRINNNPRFLFVFQDRWQYSWERNKPVFESLGFHNAYIVAMAIFDEYGFWMGPFYLRDWNSMIFNNGNYREFIRVTTDS